MVEATAMGNDYDEYENDDDELFEDEEEVDAADSDKKKVMILGGVAAAAALALVVIALFLTGVIGGGDGDSADTPDPDFAAQAEAAKKAKAAREKAERENAAAGEAAAEQSLPDPHALRLDDLLVPFYDAGRLQGHLCRVRPGVAVMPAVDHLADREGFWVLVRNAERSVLSRATRVETDGEALAFDKDGPARPLHWFTFADPLPPPDIEFADRQPATNEVLALVGTTIAPARFAATWNGKVELGNGRTAALLRERPALCLTADGKTVLGFAQTQAGSVVGTLTIADQGLAPPPPDDDAPAGPGVHEQWARHEPPAALVTGTNEDAFAELARSAVHLERVPAQHLFGGRLWIPNQRDAVALAAPSAALDEDLEQRVRLIASDTGPIWGYAPEIETPGAGLRAEPPPRGERCVVLDLEGTKAVPIPAVSGGELTVYPGGGHGWLVRAEGRGRQPPHLSVCDGEGRVWGAPVTVAPSGEPGERLPAQLESEEGTWWLVNPVSVLPEFQDPPTSPEVWGHLWFDGLTAVRPGQDGKLLVIADGKVHRLDPASLEHKDVTPEFCRVHDAIDLPENRMVVFCNHLEEDKVVVWDGGQGKILGQRPGLGSEQVIDEHRRQRALPNDDGSVFAELKAGGLVFTSSNNLQPTGPPVPGAEAVFLPDRKLFLVRNTDGIRVVDRVGKLLKHVPTPQPVDDFSEGGRALKQFELVKTRNHHYPGLRPLRVHAVEDMWVAAGQAPEGELRALLPGEPDSVMLFDDARGGVLVSRQGGDLVIFQKHQMDPVSN